MADDYPAEPWIREGAAIHQEGEMACLAVTDPNAEMSNGEAEAIARRIIACVNVCAGVDTEALERAADA